MEINQLYVRQLLDSVRALSKVEHYHTFSPLTSAEMTGCDLCQKMDRFLNQIEEQLGPNPAMAKTIEEFEKLIMSDPLSKRLFDMGRKYQADKWAEEKSKTFT